jgi:hypothetical protein
MYGTMKFCIDEEASSQISCPILHTHNARVPEEKEGKIESGNSSFQNTYVSMGRTGKKLWMLFDFNSSDCNENSLPMYLQVPWT